MQIGNKSNMHRASSCDNGIFAKRYSVRFATAILPISVVRENLLAFCVRFNWFMYKKLYKSVCFSHEIKHINIALFKLSYITRGNGI